MRSGSAGYNLTLDQTVTYEITVSGGLGDDWSDWVDPEVRIEPCRAWNQDTRIVGAFDQAGLHGLLRRLYSVGVPLLSVRVIGAAGSVEERT